MKRTIVCTLLSAFLIIGAAGPRTIKAEDREGWPKLPELRFQNCIAATQSIKHNPFSTIDNDFFLVTAYEEDEKNAGSDQSEPPFTTSALNVYLVVGIIMAEDKSAGRVHDMALIVEERNRGDKKVAGPSHKRWVLLDENGDGRLDRAIFGENPVRKVNGAPAGKKAQEIASEKLPSLQGYFDSAVRDLSKKALNGAVKACLFV